MCCDRPLHELLDQWRAGDQQAALAIFRRYEQRICRFAQPRINPKFYPRFDDEAIMATVLRTVLRRIQHGQYGVDSEGSIWKLIMKVTSNKIKKYAECHHAGKRTVDKEVNVQGEAELFERISRQEPLPEDLAALADELQDLRNKLKPGSLDILDMLLKGYTKREIAEKLGHHYHTVAPKVKSLQQFLGDRAERQE